jgi:predicted Fe-Mo cluster-binding NifX family protein
MIAAMKGHESVVRLLIKMNADTTILDEQGSNAAAYARHNGFDYIARIIEGRD